MRIAMMALVLASVLPVVAGTVGWRMDGTGCFPTATLPAKWGPADGVLWATELPATSNSSPVLVGERLFTTAEPYTLFCMNRDGKILWQRANGYEDLLDDAQKAALLKEREQMAALDRQENDLRRTTKATQQQQQQAEKDLQARPDDEALKANVDKLKADVATLQTQLNDLRRQKAALPLAEQYRVPQTHPANGYASDTPICDGTRVYASFGNGVVACYALDGTRLWARLVQKPQHGWGHSCSPMLADGKLFVQYVDLFALDPATGETKWSRKCGHDWGTPAPVHVGTLRLLLTDAGDFLSTTDGTTVGRTGYRQEYNSPLIVGDVAYGASDANAWAFRLSQQADGTLQTTKLWQTNIAKDRYYASPLLHDGLIYVVNQGGTMSALDAKTGEKLYEQRLNLGGTCYPSPVLAGNVLLFAGDSGKAVILQPGRTYQEIGRCVLEPFRGTPICEGKRLYIRTMQAGRTPAKLYCFGG